MKINLIGKIFGRLRVIGYAGKNKRRQTLWNCVCNCGEKPIVLSYSLRSGRTVSCGCFIRELLLQKSTSHGHARQGKETPEYRAWQHAKSRCFNPRVWNYEEYGGRGITMSEDWKNSFENFLKDMGPRPSNNYSLDRYPNNDGNYEPGNCRWATSSEQAFNRRKAR